MSTTNITYTQEEQKNIELAKEYMLIAYDPKRASAEAVAHLCAPGNKFIAPTTFPGVNTLEEYAEDHGKIMQQVNDLHIVNFDVLFAKGDSVCIRYTAEGTHSGAPHGDIEASGKKAQWTEACVVQGRKWKVGSRSFADWNKLSM